jgi:glycosyltransferase involved in cell wall biosynthesis
MWKTGSAQVPPLDLKWDALDRIGCEEVSAGAEGMRLSVVLPVLNCRNLIESHLPSMAGWLDLADEIVVVDSQSSDGTLDYILAHLHHPALRVIQRGRGLYDSWNEGIAATKGRWVYISTSGDSIERGHLLHLMALGEAAHADVVVSSPRFKGEDGQPRKDLDWPPSVLMKEFGNAQAFIIHPEAAQYLAFRFCPQALLGSSASNVYRGDHLRSRPFPNEYGSVGDTGWIMRYSAETLLCMTPAVGSTFCIHPKEREFTHLQCVRLHETLVQEEFCRLESRLLVSRLLREDYFRERNRLSRTLWIRKHELWHAEDRNLANRIRWVGATWAYLLQRSREKVHDGMRRLTSASNQKWVHYLGGDGQGDGKAQVDRNQEVP